MQLLRSLLEDYKACLSVDDSSEAVTMTEALDPTSLEQRLQALGVWCQGTVNREKRDLMDSYLMLSRSNEDLCMLKEEASNVIQYYDKKKKLLLRVLDVALLHGMLTEMSKSLQEAHKVVNSMCGGLGRTLLQ